MMAETQSSNTERFPTFAEWIGVDIHSDEGPIAPEQAGILYATYRLAQAWHQLGRALRAELEPVVIVLNRAIRRK